MIRTRRGLITVAVVIFLVGLVALFPARVAYHWFAPPGVAVSNISGSVWNGAAAEASINNLYLYDLRWRFRPTSLFSGGIGFHLEAKPVSGFLESTIVAGFGGTVELQELTASLPLDVLGGALQVSGLRGNASLQFERLAMSDTALTAADGTLTVGNVAVPMIARESLGGYRAEFATQASGINASIEDTDGVVDLAATLVIRSDRSYDLEGLVVAKPETPTALRRQMEFLGPANERGQREIRLGGTY